MIPLRDNAAPRRFTPVNVILIAANLAIFVHEVMLGPFVVAFIDRYAMVPAVVWDALRGHPIGLAGAIEQSGVADASVNPLVTIFTSMFIHGGFWHVAGNMLYLFIFGAAVEYRLGPLRYLIFYLAAGIAAALATVAIAPGATVPVIGASGAIAGVLGAYFVFYPRGRILTILPIFIFIQFIEIPAVIYLLLWFALQLFSGISDGSAGAMNGGVAWWAHVGGFLFGIAVAPMLASSEPSRIRRR
ncbi:MAG: Rhomboid family protein [Candidatus Binatus sp.]|jgi:membrane associated rhomboid family serine protease|nr:Rhomboid family protein [Candidatus Binatus sp.]